MNVPVRPGEVIAGKYRVQRILGMGGMGAVVAAEHLDLGEMRAIKLMLPVAAANAPTVERFLREARAASRLKSQHVARVYDIGRMDSGSPYIVMELLGGADLKAILERNRQLPVEVAVRYLVQACEAIGEAHALGIVHRDIKPGNIFVTVGPRGEDCVKVLDFGIAKVTEEPAAVQITRTQEALGTPLYMSPEQMRSTRATDERTDVWSLGVLLYRMLVGREPFTGDTVTAVCSAVIADTPVPPSVARPDVPPDLERIVLSCLSKDPAGRFANAIQLGNALAGCLVASGPAGRSSQVHEQRGSVAALPPAPSADAARTSAVPASGQRTPRGTQIIALEAPVLSSGPAGAQTTRAPLVMDPPVSSAAHPARSPRRIDAWQIPAIIVSLVALGFALALFFLAQDRQSGASTTVAADAPATSPPSASQPARGTVPAAAPAPSAVPAPVSEPTASGSPTAGGSPSRSPTSPVGRGESPPPKPAPPPPSASVPAEAAPPGEIVDPWAPKPPKPRSVDPASP